MKRSSILLTGGGFIGTALARRLSADGKHVHLVTRTATTFRNQNVSVHLSDLSDPEILNDLLTECGTVVHLACSTLPGTSARSPSMELKNLIPGLQLMDALRKQENTHVMFLSSGGTVYGNPATNPVAEAATLAPRSYHGAGKVAMEGFFNALRTSGHPVTTLRPSNAYGPGQSFREGFGLIRTLLERAKAGSPIEIWGDGQSVRDFIFIDDVTEACSRLIDIPKDSGTYNLGTGTGHTLNEVLHIIKDISNAEPTIIYRPSRRIDVREIVLDTSKLEERLQWRAQTTLEEGISRTWKWLTEVRAD